MAGKQLSASNEEKKRQRVREREEKSLRKEKKRQDSRSRHEPLRCRFLLVLIQISVSCPCTVFCIFSFLVSGLSGLYRSLCLLTRYQTNPSIPLWLVPFSVFVSIYYYLPISISQSRLVGVVSHSPESPPPLPHYHYRYHYHYHKPPPPPATAAISILFLRIIPCRGLKKNLFRISGA